jgi:hypothetical protein
MPTTACRAVGGAGAAARVRPGALVKQPLQGAASSGAGRGQGLLLEELYVLLIEERDGAVEFSLDAVLNPCHVAYRSPRAGEQHCYRRGKLVVTSVERPRLRRSGAPPTTEGLRPAR